MPGRHGAASIFPLIRFWIGLNIKRRRNRQALFILLEFFSFSSCLERVRGIQSPLLGSRFIISNKHQQSVCASSIFWHRWWGSAAQPNNTSNNWCYTAKQQHKLHSGTLRRRLQWHANHTLNKSITRNACVPCVKRTRQQQNVELATLWRTASTQLFLFFCFYYYWTFLLLLLLLFVLEVIIYKSARRPA